MVQAMRGATKVCAVLFMRLMFQLLGSMNRNMNLPAIQRIMMDFERENDMMDQRQEMMSDAIDDTFEDEEEETDEIVDQVLDEIGIDLSQSVCTSSIAAEFNVRSLEKLHKRVSISNSLLLIQSLRPLAPMTIYKLDSIV
jgi:division protein CdvB (Snf7/Vps24/ESCRT-III family)